MSDLSDEPRLMHVATIPATFSFLAGQIAHMRQRGFEVHTVSSPGELPAGLAESESVEHHPIEMTRRITPFRDIFALSELAHWMRIARPTIVHSHTPKAGLLGMIAARLAGVPVRIYHIHGLPFMTATGYRRQLLRYSERVSCRLADQVLCVSHSIREVAISEGFCPPGKIKVLHRGSINGVDAQGKFDPDAYPDTVRSEIRRNYGIPEDALVIGFVGRVVRDKGVRELAEAWTQLRDRFADARLLIVGDFETEDPIPACTQQALRGDYRVHLAGLVWDMPPLYRAMDVVVLPTYREGFPVVPLEAAAMRLPVVATNVPGCIDAVVDNITGILVPAKDPRALRDAVGSYLADPAKRAAHGKSARQRVVTAFRPGDIWEATYVEYRRLMDQAGIEY